MPNARSITTGIAFFLNLYAFVGFLHAGGPVLFNEEDGQPVFWFNNRAVYVVEQGRVSDAISNQEAVEAVKRAFARWTDVGRPNRPLAVDRLLDSSCQCRFSYIRWSSMFNENKVVPARQLRPIGIFTTR